MKSTNTSLVKAHTVKVVDQPLIKVQFSCSVMSDSATPWTAAHQAFLSTGACSNSCPSSHWCHRTNSSSVVPFSSCPQSSLALGSFGRSPFFTSGGQSIGVSASASVLPVNIQDWFPLGLTGLISLQSKGLSRVFSNTTDEKHQFFGAQLFLWSNSHIHMWLLEKSKLWLEELVCKVMSMLFNMLSRLVIAVLPRSKRLLISWLQSPSAVVLEPPQNKVCHCFHCFCVCLPWSDGTRCHGFHFLNVEF